MCQNNKYMVCTRCLTYNHAAYIEDALRGFALQEVSFPVVYCVIDDASTDGGADIIRKWAIDNLDLEEIGVAHREQLSYGELIVAKQKNNSYALFVILLLNKNHHQTKTLKLPYVANWLNDSKYLAICEGDDYWVASDKLQKQVNFLEKNPDYGMCFGNIVQIVNGKQVDCNSSKQKYEDIRNLILHNGISNLTTMVKRELYQNYKATIVPNNKNWKMGDYPMWLWVVLESKVHYIDEVFGAYRVLKESASHSQDYKKRLSFIESARDIRLFFAKKYLMGEELINSINDVYYREKAILVKGKDRVAYREALRNISDRTFKERIKYILSGFYFVK